MHSYNTIVRCVYAIIGLLLSMVLSAQAATYNNSYQVYETGNGSSKISGFFCMNHPQIPFLI